MDDIKERIEPYLSEVEGFLTSLLLEETKISITAVQEVEGEGIMNTLQKEDIYLYSRNEGTESDFIIILDQDWLGLLSSIMLGIEEKKFNEVTKDLLKKFSGELSKTLLEKFQENGITLDLQKAQAYTRGQLEQQFCHTAYSIARLEVEGLADENVRAAIMIGDPEAQIKKVEEKPKKEEEGSKDKSKEFTSFDEEDMSNMGSQEEVISGRYIEFEEFGDNHPLKNGDGNSMDLLKDVEMDVSVELGRIELPLGKVLQLAKGSVIELEKLAGEPVDILVNGQRIAHGEVVVIDEHFGVRISNLITTRQRLATLN